MSDTLPNSYLALSSFAAAANAGPELQAATDTDRLAFCGNQAERLHWHEEWKYSVSIYYTAPPSCGRS